MDRVDVVNIALAFGFNSSLISMPSVNFRIFSLFLRIPEICCLLILNSSAKFVVPFSPFSEGEIIVCMSFIKRTDLLFCRHGNWSCVYITHTESSMTFP